MHYVKISALLKMGMWKASLWYSYFDVYSQNNYQNYALVTRLLISSNKPLNVEVTIMVLMFKQLLLESLLKSFLSV